MSTLVARKFTAEKPPRTYDSYNTQHHSISTQHRLNKMNSDNQHYNKHDNHESGYHSSHEIHPDYKSRPSPSTSNDEDINTIKCVLVGDGAVGKTAMAISYSKNGFPSEYIPTAFDNYTVRVHVNDEPIKLQLSDTAGQNDLDTLRPLCYKDCDVFLLCFSVVSPTSFYNLATQWVPEIRRHAPGAKLIVCGTQTDLRSNVQLRVELRDYGESPVTSSEGEEYAREIEAVAYTECSALTQHRLKEVFDLCIVTGLPLMEQRAKKRHSDSARNSLHKIKEKICSASQSRANFTPVLHHKGAAPQPPNSSTMLKRQNSQTRLNDVARIDDSTRRPSTTSSNATNQRIIINQSINESDRAPSKIKQGWHRFLCFTKLSTR